MKKMKLFATVSVLCLGIAAVANTQSHAKATIDGYQDNGGVCTTVISQACSDGTAHNCVDGSNAAIYQRDASHACSVQLAKK